MNLKGRHLLKIMDLTPEEMTYLIDLAADLKAKKKAGEPVDMFRGKNIALILKRRARVRDVLLKWRDTIWVWE